MMTGIEEGFTGCVFLGYHAGAGTAAAILDHTFTGWFADIRVNGLSWNETHLNAALAGTFNVPLLFVSGDEECCNQATAALPWVRAFATKTGFAAMSGRSKSPKSVQDATRRGPAPHGAAGGRGRADGARGRAGADHVERIRARARGDHQALLGRVHALRATRPACGDPRGVRGSAT